MAAHQPRATHRRLKILAVTALVAVVLAGGAYVGWKARKRAMVNAALVEGTAAYERGDWETARRMLGRWISVHPDDTAVLAKYARAQLSLRPLPSDAIRQAIGAYRVLLRTSPADEPAFRRLALLYELTGNFGELEHIADKRLAAVPDDPAAILARAKSLLYREKPEACREQLEALVQRLGEREPQRPELVEACILLGALTAQAVPAGGDAARAAEALGWLTRALEHQPESAAALVQRAALRRTLADRTRRPLSAADAQAARDDLEQAEKLPLPDPRARLALAEEWLAHREYDRAAVVLEAAGKLDPESLTDVFVDPADWMVALFAQNAKLALLTAQRERGVQLAQEALERLRGRPQRTQVIPFAVELFVLADRTLEARELLDEYLDAMKLVRAGAAGEEQTAYLQAIVASAENQPYRVIELLEPVADRPTARPLIRVMLAEAYSRTGQIGRATKVLAQERAERPTTPQTAMQLARLHLGRGAWTEALDALAPLEETQRDADVQLLELAARLGLAGQEPPEKRSALLAELAGGLARLREAEPQRSDVRILLASVAEQQGRPEVAEAELRRAGAECADPLPALLALSRLQASAGRPEEAVAGLRSACERFAERATPWLALADLLASRSRPDEARAVLRGGVEAVTSPEDRRRVAVALASLDILHGEAAGGIAALRALAAEDMGDVQVRALLLEVPEVSQDRAGAQQLVDQIKAAEGGSGLVWRLQQARVWLAGPERHARQGEIVELLRYCIEADPTRIVPVLLLGRAYEDAGDFAAAEAVYHGGFRATGAPEVADRLVALLQRQKRYSEVRALLAQVAQKLDERMLSSWRIALAVGEGQYGEAVNELELRLAGRQKDPLDLVRLAGLSYAQTRAAERALAYLDQAAALGADPPTVTRTRVAILRAERREDEAEQALNDLVGQAASPEAYTLRASYYIGTGREDLAERDYRELARISKDGFGHALLGEFYAQTGRLDRAIDTWMEGLQVHPDATQLKRGLSKALLTRKQPGDREIAATLLDELRQELPDDTDLLWIMAVRNADAGTPEKRASARELLKQAVVSSPAGAETYRGLAELAFRLEDFATARDLAQRGARLHPDNAGLLLLQTRAELALGNLDAARQAAMATRLIEPRNPEALEILIEIAIRRKDTAGLEGALAIVRQLVQEEPERDAWQILRARVHAGLGQPDVALSALEVFAQTDAGRASVPTHLTLHDLYRKRGDAAAAERALAAAGALAPDHLAVVHARLVALAEAKRFDEVLELAKQQQQRERPRPEILLSAASLLGASPAHLDAALALCQQAVELNPEDARAYLSLGELAYGKGDVERSIAAYRAALRIDPAQPEALNNLAWVLAEKRAAYAEALTHARQAVALRPGDANFRDTLAFILRNTPGKLKEARDEFRRCAELAGAGSPLRARALFNLAQVCSALEEWDAVPGHLKDALAAENGGQVFTPDERAQIEQLLRAAHESGRVSVAKPR